jgi:(p)ppGpp synthase/HD superfamily hydrolase
MSTSAPTSQAVLDDPLVRRARDCAQAWFAGVTRKAGGAPYFGHLEDVARLTAEYSDDPAVVAAAYLHDAVEDGLAVQEQIETEFGPRVLALTLSVTEQKEGGTWQSRKAAYVAQIDNVDTAIIAGADKVDNLEDLLAVADWSVFNADPRHKIEHYRHVGVAVQHYVPALGARILALCDELAAQLNRST